MPMPREIVQNPMGSLARELLVFHDDLTAFHACNAFMLQALATALANGSGVDERTATGAMFCAQWLNDQSAELDQRLKKIRAHTRVATETGKPG